MRRIVTIWICAVAMTTGAAWNNANAETFELDAGHTSMYFAIDHLGYSKTFGRFNTFSAEIVLAGEDSKFNFVIDPASVDTANETRDKHLRSADYFNAKQFPEIKFETKDVTVDGDLYTVKGHLTLTGATKPLTIKLTKLKEAKDPWGKHRVGFDTQFVLDRTEWGMDGGVKQGVGKDVTMMVSFEAIKPE